MDQVNAKAAASVQTDSGAALFEARSISKSFGSVKANQDVSLTVKSGEKLALLGENGAGKSTLVKMINGVLKPDSGAFFWNGKRVSLSSPATARRIGIGMVFQHFSSFEALTVLENLAIALPSFSIRKIRKELAGIKERYGLEINPNHRVERLSAGEKQRVEIVRALLQKPKLLILDEPTSVLTPQEATSLFATLNSLAADGMALIYISHRLPEIQELCDRATVLRHGEVVGSCIPSETSVSQIAEMMIGKTADPIRRVDAFVGGVRLQVENLSVRVTDGVPLKDVSFTARRGEIMGIAGVAGEGQEALFSALSGEKRVRRGKSIQIDGRPIGSLGPKARRKLMGSFAPEQRLGHAAIADLPLSENLRLTHHGLPGSGRRTLRKRTQKIRETYDVRAAAGDPKAGTLSGGNLQKFVIGRELDREPSVFIVAQPTWGVDAGAASFIRNALLELTQRGAAVVLISQDLDEIFQIADRVAVLHRGNLSDTYSIHEMTPDKIGLLMSGADITNYAPPPPRTEPKPVASIADARAQAITPDQQTATSTQQAPVQQPVAPPQYSTTSIQQTAASIQRPAAPSQLPASTQNPAPKEPAAPPLQFSTSGTLTANWTEPETIQNFEKRP